MVKIVDAELKIEVNDDISAANITANIKPLKTVKKSQKQKLATLAIIPKYLLNGHNFSTRNTKATLEHPVSELQIDLQASGLEQAT